MINIAEITTGTSFQFPVTDFLGNAQAFLVVLYCSLKFPEGMINTAEIKIGISFQFPVTDFLGNAQAFLVVLYCSLEFPEGFISNAEIVIGLSFTSSATVFFLINAQVLIEVLYCLMEVTEGVIIASQSPGTYFLCPVFNDLRFWKTYFLFSYILQYSFCHFEVLVLKVELFLRRSVSLEVRGGKKKAKQLSLVHLKSIENILSPLDR